MGGFGSKPKITKYTPLFAEVLRCNILEIDRIFVLIDDVIDVGEKIRNQVISSRELIIRIAKVHHYQNPTITDAFKVWTWVVGICNDGSLEGIEFKADWNDIRQTRKRRRRITKTKTLSSNSRMLLRMLLKKPRIPSKRASERSWTSAKRPSRKQRRRLRPSSRERNSLRRTRRKIRNLMGLKLPGGLLENARTSEWRPSPA